MIKKIFYFIVATIVFANCSNAPQAPTSFVVEGTLPDSSFHGEQIYMQRYTDGKTMGVTKVEGNRFTFTGVADSADYCRIEVGPRLYSNLILENGHINVKMVNINAFGRQPFATGTPGNEEYARIHLLADEAYAHHNDRIDSLRQIYPDEQKLIKAAQPLVKELHQKMTAQAKELFAAHRDDVIGYTLLYSVFLDGLSLDDQIEVIESTGPSILQTDLAQEKLRKLHRLKKTQPGTPYIDIKGKDANGKDIALSDFIGKGNYVLIDMWSSWCGPCKAEVPNIAENYREFKDKGLSVVGIFVWDEAENLAPCMKELNITWPQIVAETSVQKDYGIEGIPEMILFAPDGTIVERGGALRGAGLKHVLKKYLDNGERGQAELGYQSINHSKK